MQCSHGIAEIDCTSYFRFELLKVDAILERAHRCSNSIKSWYHQWYFLRGFDDLWPVQNLLKAASDYVLRQNFTPWIFQTRKIEGGVDLLVSLEVVVLLVLRQCGLLTICLRIRGFGGLGLLLLVSFSEEGSDDWKTRSSCKDVCEWFDCEHYQLW
jgi:hypothetical protein